MTQKRYDSHSTEFGLWLRDQKEIDSSLGYLATNIDYVWKNYNTEKWMFIEEKRFMSKVKSWQHEIFKALHIWAKRDPNFCGFHLIQFEKTSPEDGKIFLDKKEISKNNLIKFLQFK